MDELVSTCTGDCCVVFTLPYDYEQVREKMHVIEDGTFIADMLVPLTKDQAAKRVAELMSATGQAAFEGDDTKHYFTCVHWDESTRRCGAYDERPRMCRGYPYGNECQHDCMGCSLKGAS